MTVHAATAPGRRAILDLAPLELDCMNVLWETGEASVREVRDALAPAKPRAYTTIMTILDRLAHKGAVTRRKAGRAWRYAPSVSAGEARAQAVEKVVEHFFGGSAPALAEHLAGAETPRAADKQAPRVASRSTEVSSRKLASAQAASELQSPSSGRTPETRGEPAAASKMDEVLL